MPLALSWIANVPYGLHTFRSPEPLGTGVEGTGLVDPAHWDVRVLGMAQLLPQSKNAPPEHV